MSQCNQHTIKWFRSPFGALQVSSKDRASTGQCKYKNCQKRNVQGRLQPHTLRLHFEVVKCRAVHRPIAAGYCNSYCLLPDLQATWAIACRLVYGTLLSHISCMQYAVASSETQRHQDVIGKSHQALLILAFQPTSSDACSMASPFKNGLSFVSQSSSLSLDIALFSICLILSRVT